MDFFRDLTRTSTRHASDRSARCSTRRLRLLREAVWRRPGASRKYCVVGLRLARKLHSRDYTFAFADRDEVISRRLVDLLHQTIRPIDDQVRRGLCAKPEV